MTAVVRQLLIGPRRHGVVRFGHELHQALQQTDGTATMVWVPSVDDLPTHIGAESRLTHLQFTDQLFGTSPARAAAAFTALARSIRSGGATPTVTLHDVPQPSDGTHYSARVAAYREVSAVCDVVMVNSDHERQLLQESRINANVVVVPLPIAGAEPGSGPPQKIGSTLGIFGFIYPGKGHREVVDAAAGLPAHVEVHAIGSASVGHEGLVDELRCAAGRQDRVFRVTGHIDDACLLSTLRAITVPVAAHRHISASGSLNSWLTAGRRPLAPSTRYTAEIERRNPGCLNLFPDSRTGLHDAIRAALQDVNSTWLPQGVTLRPSPAEAAMAYAEIFRNLR